MQQQAHFILKTISEHPALPPLIQDLEAKKRLKMYLSDTLVFFSKKLNTNFYSIPDFYKPISKFQSSI